MPPDALGLRALNRATLDRKAVRIGGGPPRWAQRGGGDEIAAEGHRVAQFLEPAASGVDVRLVALDGRPGLARGYARGSSPMWSSARPSVALAMAWAFSAPLARMAAVPPGSASSSA